MSTAPMEPVEQRPETGSAPDPWKIPGAQPPAAPKRAGLPANPAVSAQRMARMNKLTQSQARYARRSNWKTTRGWTLAGAILRLAAAVAQVFYGLQLLNLHNLYGAPTTTQDQWQSAVHEARLGVLFDLVALLALAVSNQAWLRSRPYLAKLPGMAPHPMQSTNLVYRTLRIPAYWPPVPEGAESWTRRVSWRVPPICAWGFAVAVLAGGALARYGSPGPGRYEGQAVLSFVAAGFVLLCGLFDLVRLRHYVRWPGRA